MGPNVAYSLVRSFSPKGPGFDSQLDTEVLEN